MTTQPSTPITVNNRPFFGRIEEQNQFREALQNLRRPLRGETLPYVLLLYGDGGIGKTTLAQRFADIAKTEHPFVGAFQTLWIDWEGERRRTQALQAPREQIGAEVVFETIRAAAALHQKWRGEFNQYQAKLTALRRAAQMAAAAMPADGESDESGGVWHIPATMLGRGALDIPAKILAKVLRDHAAIYGVDITDIGETIVNAFAAQGFEIGIQKAVALVQRVQESLGREQYDLFVQP